MTNGSIQALTMPKWGLAMKEGKVGEWLTEEGFEITTGEEVLEVETDKITSAVETPHNGILRRKVASSGEVLPVGSLLAVIAESSVPQEMIDQFIENYPRGKKKLIESFSRFATGDVFEWFQDKGVKLKIEDDLRVFPVSDSSLDIVNCLKKRAQSMGIKIYIKKFVKRIINF